MQFGIKVPAFHLCFCLALVCHRGHVASTLSVLLLAYKSTVFLEGHFLHCKVFEVSESLGD